MHDSAHPRVLIIDGDSELRDALEELLLDQGFTIVTASNAQEGIALLHQQDVQVVIADFRSRDVDDPWRTLSQVKEAAGATPIGILTGWNLSEGEVRAHGFSFLLRKPVDLDALFAAVGAQAQVGQVAPSQAETIQRYFAALGAQRWDELARTCTDDVVYHLPGTDPAFSRTVRGRVEFQSFTEETFRSFPDATFEVRELVALPRSVVARYVSRWSDLQGHPREMHGAVVFEFRGDAICQLGIRLSVKQLRELHKP